MAMTSHRQWTSLCPSTRKSIYFQSQSRTLCPSKTTPRRICIRDDCCVLWPFSDPIVRGSASLCGYFGQQRRRINGFWYFENESFIFCFLFVIVCDLINIYACFECYFSKYPVAQHEFIFSCLNATVIYFRVAII